MHKIIPSVDYNWLKRMATQLNKIIDQNYMKIPKVVKPSN